MDPIVIRRIKIFSLGILGVILGFLTFFFLRNLITSSGFSNIWLILGLAWVFLVVIVLEVIFINRFFVLGWWVVAQGLTPAVAFYPFIFPTFYHLVGIASLLFLFFVFLGVHRGFRTADNSLKINFFTTARQIVPKVAVGFLIFTAIFSYFYFFQLENFSDETASYLFNKILESALPIVQIWFPGISFDMSVEKALATISETQIRKSSLEFLKQGIKLEELPPSVRERLINEAVNQAKSFFEKIGGEIKQGQTVKEYLFDAIKGRVVGLSPMVRLLLQIGVIVLLFFILKGIVFFLYIPIEFTAFVFYKLLVLIGFANVAIEKINREVIVL